MRILLGALRGLAFLYLSRTGPWALGCDQLPAGQSLWIRLSSPVSTYTAQVGDPVHAVLTQDIVCGNEIVLPMGTPVEGVVSSKHKVGWGIRHETATLELEFNQVSLGPDTTVQMTARVEEVENAREQVKNGVIHGVMSSDTFQGRINSRLIHLPTWNPYSDLGLIIYKATFPIFPEPEIYYPAGTDLRLKTKAAMTSIRSDDGQPCGKQRRRCIASRCLGAAGAAADHDAEVGRCRPGQYCLSGIARASRGCLSRGRLAHQRSGVAARGDAELLRFAEQQRLRAATDEDVSADGKPEDMNWQKSLNSYGRRDHLRIWQWTPEGATEPVWVSSSTHDTGAVLSVKYKGFVHHISPDIDDERAKVIRDLNFAGCVQSVSYVSRPGIPTVTQNATGDLVRTDGSVAVVQLQDCQPVVPGLAANPSTAGFRPGNHVFRYIRREILTFRNDIWRANMIYGAYDLGRMAVAALRHQPVPPMNDDNKPTTAVLPATTAFRSGID